MTLHDVAQALLHAADRTRMCEDVEALLPHCLEREARDIGRREPARPPERLIHRSAKHGGCLMSLPDCMAVRVRAMKSSLSGLASARSAGRWRCESAMPVST